MNAVEHLKEKYRQALTENQRQNLINWVAALRSDKYRQIKGILKDPFANGMCCLGVACDLINPNLWGPDGEYYYPTKVSSNFELELPPIQVQKLYGLDEDLCRQFASYNDEEDLSFAEIADKIESFFDLKTSTEPQDK